VDASSVVAPPPSERNPGRSLHRFANPGRFLRLSGAVLPWLAAGGAGFLAIGLIWGLFFAPADWQQGDAVRIMYVHVPAAWLASAGYLSLAVCSAIALVWRHPLADLAAAEIGPVGVGIELVERLEAKYVAGVNRVRIAQPGLDLRHRQLARARG